MFGIFVFGFLFVSGIELVNRKGYENHTTEFLNKGFIVASITENTTEKDKIIKAILDVKAIKSDNEWFSSEGKTIVYFEKDSLAKTLNIGDEIIFEPKFDEVENAGNPHEFDYKKYLAFHLITQQTYLKSGKWNVFKRAGSRGIMYYSEMCRQYLLSLFQQSNITGDEYAVLSALTLGYNNKLEEDIKKAYSSSGATHVLSVSGLHVGIVYIVMGYLLLFLRKSKFGMILRTTILILFLWAYAFVTGLSPAVMRSATMFSFVVLGSALRRESSIYNTLASSAFFLIFLNPYVITNIGFQLSYLALIGIVFFQAKIYNLIYVKNYFLDKIWALVAVSIAAQLTTTPISLMYFHQFPNYFLISNIVVVPLSTLIVYAAMILLAFSFVPFLTVWLGKMLSFLVYALNKSVILVEQLPYAISSDIQIDGFQVLLFYVLIIFIGLTIVYRRVLYIQISFVSIVFILAIGIYNSYHAIHQKRLIVYNMRGTSAYNFIDGDDNILFSNYQAKMDYSKMLYSVKNNWLNMGVSNEKIIDLSQLGSQFLFSNLMTIDNRHIFVKNNFIQYYDKRIYLLKDKIELDLVENSKIKVDYIIVSNNCKVPIDELQHKFSNPKFIIDSSNSTTVVDYWKTVCKASKISFHNVNEQGAFVVEI
ncbi:MAG: hypothetical protein A2W98_11760 [Bacteroidetes bacterium GWF2_33_38]|nr:MAG: hypothetical protein A2W98_11760 [Bacteroidetes bacterium GWF2_33_38]OFY76374.1 MAG: hypothetical protein A2265_02045 [Bacteroidetes bacterium RIFOXYA12_FULL_33_9]